MLVELISEKNNTYEFSIKFNTNAETISIYAPNYDTALKRANAYIKSLEPEVYIMSNNLLWKSLHSSQVYMKDDSILIDELFNIVEASIRSDNYIVIAIFTQLNYVNTDEIVSHHSNMGKYFYNKQGEIIRFMLDQKKCMHIDEKHDRLRKSLYYTN